MALLPANLQIAGAPEVTSVVVTPTLASLALSHDNTKPTLHICGFGDDFKRIDKVTWKATVVHGPLGSVDFAGGVTLRRRVNVTEAVGSMGSQGQSAVMLALPIFAAAAG